MKQFILFITLSFAPFLSGTCQEVASIRFDGITKTKPDYLAALIETKVGQAFDSTLFSADIQTLKNLNLFFSVTGQRVAIADGKTSIIFTIQEAVYLYPILSVSGFKDQLKIQAGGNQINFLGKAQSLGVLYQYYDRHSLSIFYTAPRHSNGKTGHEVALSKYSTIEPLYFADTVSSFNFDNYSISLGGFYWLHNKIRLGLGGMYMWEKYEQRDDAPIEGYDTKIFNFNKYQIRLQANYEAINQHFEFRDGISAAYFSEIIQTEGFPEASFLKATTQVKYFKRVGNKGNLGVQGKFGVSTNNMSPFAPFVLDGFLNVRGIGNRVARGTAELIFNGEYRHTLLKKKYFIAQIAGFADYGSLRSPGAPLSELFRQQETNLFLGAGIRLHSRLIYKTIFRLDYSINPTNTQARAFTFGLGQFF